MQNVPISGLDDMLMRRLPFCKGLMWKLHSNYMKEQGLILLNKLYVFFLLMRFFLLVYSN
uniref:Uncharacterized protein n=1 Tax=Anguilla anguilla TaxID=7936 RepID=A0A0E9XDX7_ANGAN